MQKCYTLLEWKVNRSVTLYWSGKWIEVLHFSLLLYTKSQCTWGDWVRVCLHVCTCLRACACKSVCLYVRPNNCHHLTVCALLFLSVSVRVYILVCVCVCVSVCVRFHLFLYTVQYSTAPCCTCVHRESRACSLSTAVYRRTFKNKMYEWNIDVKNERM